MAGARTLSDINSLTLYSTQRQSMSFSVYTQPAFLSYSMRVLGMRL
jgi:hypothetical protein